MDNHAKGCGNSRKEEDIVEEDHKHELFGAGNEPGTVILISNEGQQQAFMVANMGEEQTITLTQDV